MIRSDMLLWCCCSLIVPATALPARFLDHELHTVIKDSATANAATQIDAVSPSAIPSGAPDTQVALTGTGLDQISRVYLLGPNKNWIQLALRKSGRSTRASITIPSSYLSKPGVIVLSPAPDFRFAQSILVYAPEVAQAVVDPNWKITAIPEDIGAGGQILVNGSGFEGGMKAVLGRGDVAGIILRSRVLDPTDLQVDIPEYIPGDDLFIAVLSANGRKRSAPFGVMSTFPEREDEFSQKAVKPSADQLNDQGFRLMESEKVEAAALKFVQATRVPLCRAGVWYAPKKCALFANNAGFAYYKLQRYEESITWIRKAIAIDPDRAIAYVNLGDALVKLKHNSDACQAYSKYLEIAPHSKLADEVRRKLNALPPAH